MQGDLSALHDVCQRFQFVVLAVAIRSGADLEQVVECVDPLLRAMCRKLVDGEVTPEQWCERLEESVQRHFNVHGETGHLAALQAGDDSPDTLTSSLSSIPRLAKRKIVRSMLPRILLPELLAILLRYVSELSPAEMVGLVAESEEEVHQKLTSVYEQLQTEVRTRLADSQQQQNL